MKEKIPKEALQFFYDYGTITGGCNRNDYTFMPFYLEVIDREESIVVMHALDNLPTELTDILKIHRVDERHNL